VTSKEEIRKEMLARRAALGEDEITEASAAVERNLLALPEFLKVGSVGFYYPLPGEIDTRGMMGKAEALGKEVFLPKTGTRGMGFHRFEGFENLEKGPFGVMEPQGTEAGAPEALVVPGVAFDFAGHRLGFGKGYYDSYLSKHSAYAIGVCFSWQVLGELPREKHDAQMDVVVAEEWVIELG
jgi:5-formyltetrahydrofolate cyclo-ligase